MTKKQVKFTKRPVAASPPTEAADAWVNANRDNDKAGRVETPAVPEEPMKRLTIDIPESLHIRVKSQCARRGTKMADEIRALLEGHFPQEG
jgi:ParG